MAMSWAWHLLEQMFSSSFESWELYSKDVIQREGAMDPTTLFLISIFLLKYFWKWPVFGAIHLS